jgi:hypothetical protein
VVIPDPNASLTLIARSAADNAPLAGLLFALWYEGRPIPRAVLRRIASIRGTATTTDASGRATVPLLPSGRYDFAFLAPGSALPSPSTWQNVEVGPGETVVTQKLAIR